MIKLYSDTNVIVTVKSKLLCYQMNRQR